MKRIANTAIVPVEADNTAWTLTPTTVALMGHELAAPKYDVAKDGDVYVLTSVEGAAIRLHFGKRSPVYHTAFECAMAAKAAKQPKAAAEPAKPVETKPAAEAKPAKQAKPAKPAAKPAGKHAKAEPAAKPTAKAVQPVSEVKPARHAKSAEPAAKPTANAVQPVAETKPAKAAKPAKQAKPAKPAAEPAKPVEVKSAEPAKPVNAAAAFEGKGWRIVYDEAAQRTRVIAEDPTPAQRSAIEAAGFWWSNTTKSWNKKLTRKAQRAAQALSETLTALDA